MHCGGVEWGDTELEQDQERVGNGLRGIWNSCNARDQKENIGGGIEGGVFLLHFSIPSPRVSQSLQSMVTWECREGGEKEQQHSASVVRH